MIGIVVVTHGRLAIEFVDALEHIVGKQKQIAAVCIGPEDDMERRREDILSQVQDVDSGDGVVLLTDMFGGTPSNLAISVMGISTDSDRAGADGRQIEVIAGINLPLLVKLASLREGVPLEDAVTQAQEAGRKYISVASRLLLTGNG